DRGDVDADGRQAVAAGRRRRRARRPRAPAARRSQLLVVGRRHDRPSRRRGVQGAGRGRYRARPEQGCGPVGGRARRRRGRHDVRVGAGGARVRRRRPPARTCRARRTALAARSRIADACGSGRGGRRGGALVRRVRAARHAARGHRDAGARDHRDRPRSRVRARPRHARRRDLRHDTGRARAACAQRHVALVGGRARCRRDRPLISAMVTPSVNEARLAEAPAGAPVRAPAEDPRDAIGARFARVAARHPGHAAVVEDGVETSYAALDARASAIAQRIVACGRRGAVGLLFERKRDAIEALLGACRSGQPYVPLDGGDPDARLAFIVADCEPAAIVAESSLAARARALAPRGCEVIDAADAREVDGAFAAPAVSSDSPAMIYYTSVSTGEPKGVVQTHANLMHFAKGYAATLGLTARDRFALLYTLAFAAGNNGVLRSVLCGATVCAFDLRRDGIAMLPEWLDRERISVLQTVPTVFRDLCGRLAPDRAFPHLRAVHLAGEALFAND